MTDSPTASPDPGPGDRAVGAQTPAGAQSPAAAIAPAGLPTNPPSPAPAASRWVATRGIFSLRRPLPLWGKVLCSAACLALVFFLWWFVTRGPHEERILSYATIPSPGETFEKFHSLWFDRALTRNLFASLRRVALGFALAMAVGLPIGVLCGCFKWAEAFFAPLIIFGRNIPVAALIPLTFSLFDIGELQKVMFIFIATVAFVIADTAQAIADVGGEYIDTAYTLGARRWQIIIKVLVPLAMPSVFNSLRVLFGLAFGYIMLAELVKFGNESGGLGDIINTSQKRGPKEHILLILMIIPLVAVAIDKVLFWIQRELFPHRYGGAGLLASALRAVLVSWETIKGLIFGAADATPYKVRPRDATPLPPEGSAR